MNVNLNDGMIMGFSQADPASVNLLFLALVTVIIVGTLESICKNIFN